MYFQRIPRFLCEYLKSIWNMVTHEIHKSLMHLRKLIHQCLHYRHIHKIGLYPDKYDNIAILILRRTHESFWKIKKQHLKCIPPNVSHTFVSIICQLAVIALLQRYWHCISILDLFYTNIIKKVNGRSLCADTPTFTLHIPH